MRVLPLGAAGKDQRKIATAVAPELLGFIWAIGTRAETIARMSPASPQSPMPSASGKRNTARNQPVLVGLPFQILPEIRMRK
jgi:hypothetical protein